MILRDKINSLKKNNILFSIWLFLKERYFAISIAIFLAVYCFLILRKVSWTQGVIDHTDFFFPLDIASQFKEIFSSWTGSLLGWDNTGIFSMLTLGVLVYFLQAIFNNEIASRIQYLLPLVFIFLSSYKLISYLLKDSQYKRAASFLGAYFAICNPVVLNNLFLGTTNMLFGIAFVIFSFYLLVRGIEEKKIIYAFYLGLLSVLFFHIISLVIMACLSLFYLVFYLLFKENPGAKFLFKFILLGAAIALLLNAYWLVPYSTKVFSGNFVEETFSGGRDDSILLSSTAYARLHSMSRLISYYDPVKIFVFNGPLEILAGFFFLLLIFTPFFRKKIDFYSFFFLCCVLLFLILSLGANKTFGALFTFLWEHVPLFHGFRSTRRFNQIAMISYMGILSFFIVFASEKIDKFFRNKKIFLASFYAIIFLLISFITWPFYSGNVLGTVLPMELPKPYFDITDRQTKDKFYSNMLILPKGDYPFFEWTQAKSQRKLYSNFTETSVDYTFELNFYKKPPIVLFAYSYKPIIDQIYTLMDLNFLAFHKILSFFNVEDVLVHKDYYINKESGVIDSQKFQDYLNNASTLIKDNKYFSLYSLSPKDILPKIYVPKNMNILVDKKIDTHFFNIIANLIKKEVNIAFTAESRAANFLKHPNKIYPLLFDKFNNIKIAEGSLEMSLDTLTPEKFSIEAVSENQFYKIYYRFTKQNLELLFSKRGGGIEINGVAGIVQNSEAKRFDIPLAEKTPLILFHKKEKYYLNPASTDWTEVLNGQTDLSDLNEEMIFYKQETGKEKFSLLNEKNKFDINLHDCSGQTGGIFSWQLLDKTKKEFSLESQKNNACFAMDIGEIDRAKIYTLSFAYNVISGTVPNICVSEPNLNKCLPIEEIFVNTPGEWNNYRTYFLPEKNYEKNYKIYPHFYHSPVIDNSGQSNPIKIKYRDVKVEQFGLYKSIRIGEQIKAEQPAANEQSKNLFELAAGKNTIRLLSPDIDGVNLVPDGDFEGEGNIEEKWGKLVSCSGKEEKEGQEDYYLKKVGDSFAGKKALLIASKKQNACIAPSLKLEQGYKYLFSFNYKILSGNLPSINLHTQGKSLAAANFPELNELEKNKWYYYETLIEPDSGDAILDLYFYNSPLNGEETKIIYDNVKVQKIPSFLIRSFFLKSLAEKENSLPAAINIKKINNAKYKVDVLGAKESFPLIFSESFHNFWKLYVKKTDVDLANKEIILNQPSKNSAVDNQNSDNFFTATSEEKSTYQNRGLLAYEGPNYISKSQFSVIQNENMPNGRIWDTWLPSLRKQYWQLSENEHFEANGFANGWFIDLKKLEDQGMIKKNSQGLYNFEIILEYWPQRFFVVGLLISILSLFSILFFIIYRWIKTKKKKL